MHRRDKQDHMGPGIKQSSLPSLCAVIFVTCKIMMTVPTRQVCILHPLMPSLHPQVPSIHSRVTSTQVLHYTRLALCPCYACIPNIWC